MRIRSTQTVAPQHEPTLQFSLRSVLATIGYLAIFVALCMRNHAAFRDAQESPAFSMSAMSRHYSLVWFAVGLATAVMLPSLVMLRVKIPSVLFLVAALLAVVVNCILSVGAL